MFPLLHKQVVVRVDGISSPVMYLQVHSFSNSYVKEVEIINNV